MFVRYFVEIDHPVEMVAAALEEAPRYWLAEIARKANQEGESVIARLGLPIDDELPGAFIQVVFGKPVNTGNSVRLPMSWWALGCRQAIIESEIEASPLGPGRTQLAITGRYCAPGTMVESSAERPALQRAAELAIKRFVDRTAEVLEPIMALHSTNGPAALVPVTA